MRNLGLIVAFWLTALLPINSFALGLGEIEVNSFLNQPLNAEIEVFRRVPVRSTICWSALLRAMHLPALALSARVTCLNSDLQSRRTKKVISAVILGTTALH